MWKSLDTNPALRIELISLYDNNTFCKNSFTVRFPFWIRDCLADRLCAVNLKRGTPTNPLGATTAADKTTVLNDLLDWLQRKSTDKELWQRICTWAGHVADNTLEVYEEISQKLVRELVIFDKFLGHMSSQKFIGVAPPADEVGGWNDTPMSTQSFGTGFTFEDESGATDEPETSPVTKHVAAAVSVVTTEAPKPAPAPTIKSAALPKPAPTLKKKAAAAPAPAPATTSDENSS